jgi:hypothetical protein
MGGNQQSLIADNKLQTKFEVKPTEGKEKLLLFSFLLMNLFLMLK